MTAQLIIGNSSLNQEKEEPLEVPQTKKLQGPYLGVFLIPSPNYLNNSVISFS